jgi:transcriptional regulator GlxA family with amidase domain
MAHRVVSVLGETVSMFELSVACEVFGLDRSELADPWYEHVVCGTTRGPIRSPEGIEVIVRHGLGALRRADTVVVPGWQSNRPVPDELAAAVAAAHRRGARVLSFCTGAFVLGAAGLLDGRPATTHWMYAAELARRHPGAHVQPDVLYVDDGDVLTSAGTAAGIDLCLHVVRLDHGAEVANAVARRMVVPPHRDGGQAQYAEMAVPEPGSDGLAPVLAWAVEHLDDPLTIDELARRAATSRRTFLRRFRAATGTSPHQWLVRQRVLLAQRLLETTDEPVERIAQQCGFGTAAALRLQFNREVSASPMAYRRAFRQRAG